MGIGLRAVKCFANTLLKWLSLKSYEYYEAIRYGADLICNMMFAKYVISVVI